MTTGFSGRQLQDEFTRRSYPHRPPTLCSVLVLFSEGGLEIFGIVDGRGGELYTVQDQSLFTIYENAPFAHAFYGKAIGDLVFFADTTYLVAGHSAEVIPDISVCEAAVEIDRTTRQAIKGMGARHTKLTHTLRQQRDRLDRDSDTVQKSKQCRIYLFEQDQWLTKEKQELERMEEQLEKLIQQREARDISRLQACYEHELERLVALEMEVETGVDREIKLQTPLRKRRPAVLLADEQAREERRRKRVVQKHWEEMRLLEEEVRQTEEAVRTQKRGAEGNVNKAAADKVSTNPVNKSAKTTAGSKKVETETLKPGSATQKVCPKCGVYILQHRYDDHMTKKHGATGDKGTTNPRRASTERGSANKAFQAQSVVKASQTEDIRRTSDPYDGSKGIGFLEREEGRFGSYPGHDDYEDEAHP